MRIRCLAVWTSSTDAGGRAVAVLGAAAWLFTVASSWVTRACSIFTFGVSGA